MIPQPSSPLDSSAWEAILQHMSITEIKREASSLGDEDLIHLAAWFHHLARRKNPAYLKSLDNTFDAIDSGDRMSLEAYQKLSQELNRSGV